MSTTEAIDLLLKNINALPDDEFGTIALLPFAVEGDEVTALKRKVCTAIVNLFVNAGFSMELGASTVEENRQITVACRMCSEPLFTATVGASGHVAVPAAAIIDGLGQRNRECPHQMVTLEDQRRLIEETIAAAAEQ